MILAPHSFTSQADFTAFPAKIAPDVNDRGPTFASDPENEIKPSAKPLLRPGLPAKISSVGGTVLAKYAYLSDGMKSGAYHADGSGFIYRGSLKYARHYSPALRRWLTPDPLSEKYYTSSPYAYCAGDPVNSVDIDGKDWYSYNKRTGDFTFIQATDDRFDTVVQLNRKGEKQLTLIENVEKGILTDGANFMNKNNVIAVGKEGGPSLEGVERFVIDLSEMVGKEIGGVYYSDNGDDVITHISIGRYDNNDSHKTNNYGIIALGRMFGPEHGYHYSDFITGNYHTHPLDRHYSWETRMKASPDDLKARDNELRNHPHLRFYILTQPPYGIKEYKYEYTYQSR